VDGGKQHPFGTYVKSDCEALKLDFFEFFSLICGEKKTFFNAKGSENVRKKKFFDEKSF
jgi:hypothetical protein